MLSKYTVTYGLHIMFWPALVMCVCVCMCVCDILLQRFIAVSWIERTLAWHMTKVGQKHTFICLYGVHAVFLAGKSPYIRSYTVYIYGSGQPYTWHPTRNVHNISVFRCEPATLHVMYIVSAFLAVSQPPNTWCTLFQYFTDASRPWPVDLHFDQLQCDNCNVTLFLYSSCKPARV